MIIIIDTREQKPLEFEGYETIRAKLDEGDYNIEKLIPYLVIERKSLSDFYNSITNDHERFKKEILRSKEKDKMFFIFLEGTLEYFYSMKWSDRKLKIKPEILKKIVETMENKYHLSIVECKNRKQMSKLIIALIKNIKSIDEVKENG